MPEKLHIRQAVLVEGKYDKIKLESLLDALIIPLGGFRIYKNKDMRSLIKKLAENGGVVILTDSDAAGFRIRGHIAGFVGSGSVAHVYIPDLYGKEARKRAPSKEGKLGVEGMNAAVLREAFARAGLMDSSPAPDAGITAADLREDGLSGTPDSAARRRRLLRELGLPEHLSQKALLPVLNRTLRMEEYKALAVALREEQPTTST